MPEGRAASTLSAMPSAALRRPVRAALLVLAVLGALLAVPGPAAADPGIPGGEGVQRTITYEIRTRGAVRADVGVFRRISSQTMNDRRGWSLGGSVRYVNVPSGGDFTLWLAAPSEMTSFSPVCSAEYSCRVGRNVIINDLRWRTGTSTWPSVREYRDYVVNHELGHWLGRGHVSCPSAGSPAPVMMQQSISLGGCVSNTWPVLAEKDAVARSLGVSWRSVRPDLYAVDQRGTSLHVVDGARRYAVRQGTFPTGLPRTLADRWHFAVADHDRDAVDDLVGIKVWGDSGRVEVHVLSGARAYRTRTALLVTALPRVSGRTWWFSVADTNGDGYLDLVGVNRQGAGGRTTVDVLSGATNYRTFLQRGVVTAAGASTAAVVDLDLGDHDRDGAPDLYVVHRRGGSGRTEVHVLDGETGFRQWSAHRRTPLGWTDESYDFAVDDWNGNGWDELYGIRRDGDGATAVHVFADRSYGTRVGWPETPLPQTDGLPYWRFALD